MPDELTQSSNELPNQEITGDAFSRTQTKRIVIAIILSVVITALVVGGGMYIWVRNQQKTEPEITPMATLPSASAVASPQNSVVPATTKTFSSSEYNFSFQYPAAWPEPSSETGFIDWVPYVPKSPLILGLEPLGEKKVELYPSGTKTDTFHGFVVAVLPHAASFEKVVQEIRKDSNADEILQTITNGNGSSAATYQVNGGQVTAIVEKTGGPCSYWKTAYIFGQQYDYLLYSACTADTLERTQVFDEILGSFRIL